MSLNLVSFSILNDSGFGATGNYAEADLVLLNTCSIREKAEQTVRQRLHLFRQVKTSRPGMLIGVLGYVLNLCFILVEKHALAWHRGWRAATPE